MLASDGWRASCLYALAKWISRAIRSSTSFFASDSWSTPLSSEPSLRCISTLPSLSMEFAQSFATAIMASGPSVSTVSNEDDVLFWQSVSGGHRRALLPHGKQENAGTAPIHQDDVYPFRFWRKGLYTHLAAPLRGWPHEGLELLRVEYRTAWKP